MTKVGVSSQKYRLIFTQVGFILFHLTLISEFLLYSDGAYSFFWYLIHIITSAPGYLLPGYGSITMLIILFFWVSAGFLLGYVKDRRDAAKVKTIKRSDKNKKITKNHENKSIIKDYTLKDWIMERRWNIIISTNLCAYFVIIPVIMLHLDGPAECTCCKFETDAQNTLAALASYFSEPEHTEVPTVQELKNLESLTLNKNSTVIIDGPKDEILVRVIDNTKTCVRGNIYEVYMGGTAGEWYADYEKTLLKWRTRGPLGPFE
jgi:hypothetical protein